MSKRNLILASILGLGLLMPMIAYGAQEVPGSCTVRRNEDVGDMIKGCEGVGETCDYENTDYPCGVCCLMGTILYVTDLIFGVLIGLVVIFIVIGAFKILFAGGEPEEVNKGRDFVIYAIVGLAVAILAKAVPQLVRFFIGG